MKNQEYRKKIGGGGRMIMYVSYVPGMLVKIEKLINRTKQRVNNSSETDRANSRKHGLSTAVRRYCLRIYTCVRSVNRVKANKQMSQKSSEKLPEKINEHTEYNVKQSNDLCRQSDKTKKTSKTYYPWLKNRVKNRKKRRNKKRRT